MSAYVSNRWTEPRVVSGDEPKHPVLKLVSAQTAQPARSSAGSDDSDLVARLLGGAGLVLGLAGLALGLRRRTAAPQQWEE